MSVILKGRPNGFTMALSSVGRDGEAGNGVGCFHEQGKRPRARDPAHVDDLCEQRRHAVAQEGEIIGLEGRQAAEPVNGRRDQQQHHERFAKPVQHPVEIVPALGEAEAAAEKRAIAQQGDLYGAETPACALGDVLRDALRGQPEAQRFVQPDSAVAAGQHGVGEVDVLRDRLVGEAADLVEPVTAHNKGGADTERATPCVLGWLKDVEEEPLIIDPALFGQQIVLDRIGIVIELRCLHDRDFGVRQQQAHRTFQEIPPRRKIGVEHQNDRRVSLARGRGQPVIEVSGLGALVVRPCHMTRADALAVRPQPVPPCIVKHPDRRIGIVERQRAQDRPFEDFERLIVGADRIYRRRDSYPLR